MLIKLHKCAKSIVQILESKQSFRDKSTLRYNLLLVTTFKDLITLYQYAQKRSICSPKSTKDLLNDGEFVTCFRCLVHAEPD